MKTIEYYMNLPYRLEILPDCPFVLFVGSKKLVKRKEFEKYISNALVI